ncbi:MAG: hypothetical protein OEL89_04710 [Candidatus Peregrinibacteria bacterium]|nr:hypothetical protein [Candidatus Peregrinibacteria bacterium]
MQSLLEFPVKMKDSRIFGFDLGKSSKKEEFDIGAFERKTKTIFGEKSFEISMELSRSKLF